MRLDRDGKIAVPEAEVERTCVEWLISLWPGAQYIRTNASDRRRSGAPSFAPYTLDGVFVAPCSPPLFVEWKRRSARTETTRRKGQERTEEWLTKSGYLVVRMPDGIKDPIEWFKIQACRLGVVRIADQGERMNSRLGPSANRGTMSTMHVEWKFDVDIEDADFDRASLLAAREALRAIRAHKTTATVFEVTDAETGRHRVVDLLNDRAGTSEELK